jgi:hypothetical protein
MSNPETSRRILVINDVLEEGLLYLAFLVEILGEDPNNITIVHSVNKALQTIANTSQENETFSHILCDDLFGEWTRVVSSLEEMYKNSSIKKPQIAITSDDNDRQVAVEAHGLFFIHKMAKYKITDALHAFFFGRNQKHIVLIQLSYLYDSTSFS